MSLPEINNSEKENLATSWLEEFVGWVNEHSEQNDGDKNKLEELLERRPDLATNPAILAKIGGAEARTKMIQDFKGLVMSRLLEQQGKLDDVGALFGDFPEMSQPNDSTPDA